MCCKRVGAKSVTEKQQKGTARGAAPKNAGANGRFLGAAGLHSKSFLVFHDKLL